MPHLSEQVAVRLQAPVVWSVNGANGVSENNPYGHGYISFGGNCQALKTWESLGEDDVLLLLGFEPTEYVTNLKKLTQALCGIFQILSKLTDQETAVMRIAFPVNTIRFMDAFRIIFYRLLSAWMILSLNVLKSVRD